MDLARNETMCPENLENHAFHPLRIIQTRQASRLTFLDAGVRIVVFESVTVLACGSGNLRKLGPQNTGLRGDSVSGAWHLAREA